MAAYATEKYNEIITSDEDEEGVLRTPSSTLKDDVWSLAGATVERLQFVRHEILKGGAGLAAPQIGVNHPIFIYTPDRTTENLRVVINPSFEPMGEEDVEGTEACFSVPLRCVKLNRWKKIKVRYQTLEKTWVEDILEGFAAKVFQHEMDHILGRLIVDHSSAEVTTFKDAKEFEEHMKRIHLEDSKTYTIKQSS
ncbi:MAG: peptide deformylase [Candidatus Nucleicultricaceae bacterium]